MAVPENTDEERQDALDDALEIREQRAALKQRVTSGEVTVTQVLEQGRREQVSDHLREGARIAGRIEIGQLLEAIDGLGEKGAGELLDGVGVEPDTHLDQLSHSSIELIVATLKADGYAV